MVRQQGESASKDVAMKLLDGENGGQSFLLNLRVVLLCGSQGTAGVADDLLASIRVAVRDHGSDSVVACVGGNDDGLIGVVVAQQKIRVQDIAKASERFLTLLTPDKQSVFLLQGVQRST